MEQREQKPNSFGLCRVATEEGKSQRAHIAQVTGRETLKPGQLGTELATDGLNRVLPPEPTPSRVKS